MPFVEINNASIYYQSYGDDPSTMLRTKHSPVLLIHGSTIDSHTDWDAIAPELARGYRVFAPDCRGHGRSNNPHMSYSFQELAGDVVAFIHAMGYERAHIIGHSNGGKVAHEAPTWMNEMIELHSDVNGEDYWKELLWLTMKEIISEPNSSPAELRRV